MRHIDHALHRRLSRAALLGALVLAGAQLEGRAGARGMTPRASIAAPAATSAKASGIATPAKNSPIGSGKSAALLVLRPTTAVIGQLVNFKISDVAPTAAMVATGTGYKTAYSATYYDPVYQLVLAPCPRQGRLTVPVPTSTPAATPAPAAAATVTTRLPTSQQGTIVGTFHDFDFCLPGGTTHLPAGDEGGTATIEVEQLSHLSQIGGWHYQDIETYGSATLIIRAPALAVTHKSKSTLRLSGSGFEAGEPVSLSYSYGQVMPDNCRLTRTGSHRACRSRRGLHRGHTGRECCVWQVLDHGEGADELIQCNCVTLSSAGPERVNDAGEAGGSSRGRSSPGPSPIG